MEKAELSRLSPFLSHSRQNSIYLLHRECLWHYTPTAVLQLDSNVKLSLSHQFFLILLLSFVAIGASTLFFFQEKFESNFAEYAMRIEQERLLDFRMHLTQTYGRTQDWSFLPEDASIKGQWIRLELARLYQSPKNQK